MTAQSKAELNRKARERMAVHRQTPEYREWLRRSREMRKQLKAKYRRDAGATPRDVIREAADAKRALAVARKALRDAVNALHDAHVDRYQKVMYSRRKAASRYALDPQAQRDRQAARKRAAPDSYVRQMLRSMGIANDEITPEMIEMKREAMLFRRLSRQIRKAIANHKEENHEAITEHA